MEVRNYTNHPGTNTRGYGAALTYIRAQTAFGPGLNSFIFPHLFLELSKKNAFSIGARIWEEDLVIETGWDRYNRFESHQTHTLANMIVAGPYFRKNFRNLNIEIGLSTVLYKNVRNKSDNINMGFENSYFFNILGNL
jgi:hypothetical protein